MSGAVLLRRLSRAAGFTLLAASCLLTLPAHSRTLAEVKARGTLSLCGHPDALPYASEKGDPPGFQVELGRAIAQQLGVSLEMLWIKPRYRANLVNCDMMLDNIANPELYEGKLLLTRPYARSGIALGVSRQSGEVKGFNDVKQGKIGVMVGSMAQTVLGRRGLTTSPYAFEEDMIDDLVKGELAGAAVSPGRLAWYIKNHPEAGLRLVPAFESEPELSWQVAAGFRKSDEALVEAVNAVLEKFLADGTIDRIYERYGVPHYAP